MLHAGPDAPEIDRIHTIEVLGRLVRCVARRDLNAGVVEGHVEPAEASNRAVDHRGDLSLVRYIAGNSNRLMTRRGQRVGRCTQAFLVDVGEHDGRACFGKGPCSRSPMPELAPVTRATWPLKS